MAKMPGCETCRETLAAYEDDPPCGKIGAQDLKKCEWLNPPLVAENVPVYEVFRRVSGQHIMGPAVINNTVTIKPIDLQLGPVFQVMDMLKIHTEDREWCIELIQGAYRELIS